MIQNKFFNSIFFFIIITFICFIHKFTLDINSKIELKNNIINIEHYYKICHKEILLNKNSKRYKKSINPLISIISTVYNKGKYIIRFLRSIQNQFLENIEIILIDDFSEDNSVMVLEKLQMKDERIKIIKHNKNKGILISRNEGILISAAKYVIIPDIDDILSNDILNQCLIKAEKTNTDIIIFNTYIGKNEFINHKIKEYENKIIYQPELSSFIFYGIGHLDIIDPVIRNKLIKRNILINSLNCIKNFFINTNMIFYEDTLINFILYKTAKSLYYLKSIGYYYISNPNSITKINIKNKEFINRLLYSFFFFLKFVIDYTKNSRYEKEILNAILDKEMKSILTYYFVNKINHNYNFYLKIITLLLTNKYICLSLKENLKIIQEIIIKVKSFN